MKIRRPHKLKSNKKTYIPTRLIFVDTETYQVRKSTVSTIHKLKLGWCCYWNRKTSISEDIQKWKYFTITGEFWDFVESTISTKTRTVLISHNIVFDFTILNGWNELINRGWKLTSLYEKGHTFIARYKKTSRTILVLNNANFFTTTLEKLGQQIGYSKLKVNFSTCSMQELSIYCRRDVEILIKTWQNYFEWFFVNDLGNFGVTISSQAFNTYRHRFMDHDIFIHNRKYVFNLEREGYFGGRTECFKIGNFSTGKYYALDINSMYPAVMADNEYPVKFLTYFIKPSIEILRLNLQKYCVVARVKVKTNNPIVPLRYSIPKPGKYKKIIAREWNNYQQYQENMMNANVSSVYENLSPDEVVKKWVRDNGGVRPEYVKINGHLRVREEYRQIPSYYKSKTGTPADELASSLMYEYYELANICNLNHDDCQAGYKLLQILKSKKESFDSQPSADFTLEMTDYLRKKDSQANSHNGKVIFPVGSFETVLTTPELKLALDNNAITEVLSMTIYEKASMFRQFIDFFYAERIKAKKEGRIAYDLFCKIIMNSLYGKFGQMMGEWTTVGKCGPKEIEVWHEVVQGEDIVYKYRKFCGLIQRYEKKGEAFNSFPAISAHVTAYARVKLWKLFIKAGLENVYYCDTDSIFVNSAGYENLKSEIAIDRLGMLKIEGITDDLKIFGCKQYIFGDKKKHKGKRANAIKIDDNTFEQEQWSTLETLINNKNLVDYQVYKVIKHFSGLYDKGTVNSDGQVTPLVM